MFDLKPTHNRHRWFLPVTPDLCVGAAENTFLFGGVGLAASIQAMERTCQRPVVWATAHYLSFARPGKMVDLDVWVPVAGRLTSQATVLLHIQDKKIVTVNAALGSRDDPVCDQWITMPQVPSPDACAVITPWGAHAGGLTARMEMRIARGHFHGDGALEGRGDGRLTFWVRSREGIAADARLLAILADYVPSGVAAAIGHDAGGNSLDNTIRFGRIVPTEWILCDVQIEARLRGIVHGTMHLFAPDGTLMASASQSMILRMLKRRDGDRAYEAVEANAGST